MEIPGNEFRVKSKVIQDRVKVSGKESAKTKMVLLKMKLIVCVVQPFAQRLLDRTVQLLIFQIAQYVPKHALVRHAVPCLNTILLWVIEVELMLHLLQMSSVNLNLML